MISYIISPVQKKKYIETRTILSTINIENLLIALEQGFTSEQKIPVKYR